jgi:exonuclease VII small subunit
VQKNITKIAAGLIFYIKFASQITWNMDDEVKTVIALDGKVSQLIGLYEKEKDKGLLYREKITELKEQIKSMETEIETLKEANRRLKFATAFKSKGDASDAKKIIDGLVREIETCVSLLNR